MRVLLVEDEPQVARFISKGLREQAFAVDHVPDGDQALFRAGVNDYDVMILDIMLPCRDGFSVCRSLRETGVKVPILMLTARDGLEDQIEGLNAGADDYLAKPFDFRVLLARVHALLRRASQVRPNLIEVTDLVLNTLNHSASRSGQLIRLTAKEYALLEFLMLHNGQILGRAEIAEHVWDENFDPFSNLIDVYIKRLRRKVDHGFSPPLIHTRRGEGYMLGLLA
jgi:two-component system copper resistance phosphate regulon response regulator CusR